LLNTDLENCTIQKNDVISKPLSFGAVCPFSDLTFRLIITKEKVINKTTNVHLLLPLESENVFFSMYTFSGSRNKSREFSFQTQGLPHVR
jgi:hypothetical protein